MIIIKALPNSSVYSVSLSPTLSVSVCLYKHTQTHTHKHTHTRIYIYIYTYIHEVSQNVNSETALIFTLNPVILISLG